MGTGLEFVQAFREVLLCWSADPCGAPGYTFQRQELRPEHWSLRHGGWRFACSFNRMSFTILHQQARWKLREMFLISVCVWVADFSRNHVQQLQHSCRAVSSVYAQTWHWRLHF